jgi:NAD+ synthase (glutamine-hydrolysing)
LIKIAISQSNPVLGDLNFNAELILDAAKKAIATNCQVLVTPELSLTGYPPEDLLHRESFLLEVSNKLDSLAAELSLSSNLHVIVGHPKRTIQGLKNCVSVLFQGEIIATYEKQCLPNDGVFDELRYFAAGNEGCVFNVGEYKVGLIICEDAWHVHPAIQAKNLGAQVLIIPNASPYHCGKQELREQIIKKRISEIQLPVIYVNSVGGQDELVFDGSSCIFNSFGELVCRLPQFKEVFEVVEFNGDFLVKSIAPLAKIESEIYQALILGLRDYVQKNRFPGVIIGLSGGVDSALVLALAVDALGAEKVRALMMPSCFTAEISWIDARKMALNLEVKYDEISIMPMFESFEDSLSKEFAGLPLDSTEENIQARIRGTLLMALSNKSGSIVLTTGNKSEMAVGYCTLYGDMAGGFAVIKDVSKTLVYKLCEYRNDISPIIPTRIITRPPSAELRADQKDQDSLPEYEILDFVVREYMERDSSIEAIISCGVRREDAEKIIKLIRLNEYKRRQSPIGVRITQRAFGKDWRYPITNKSFT